MFETLTRGFKSAREKLTGKTTLDASMIQDALRDVRLSLLEADVEFNVVKRFLGRVEEKALGELVTTRVAHEGQKRQLTPADHFINICHGELEALMGPVDTSLSFRKAHQVTSIMMVGLQGAGKTTTTGKLARKLIDDGHKPMLVAADIYRPAAIEQLKVLGEQLGVPVFSVPNQAPPSLCELALREAQFRGCDLVLFDTAGRLTVDETLMNELTEIKAKTRPDNILLVIDAMIGQDAVKTAKAFDDRLDLSGVVLTKLDGDARGGAALSVKEVTGKPIKFLGMGEKLDRLEEFRPEGLAGRILGFGDIVGLVQDFEQVVDEKKAEEDAKKILSGDFNMVTFLEQIRTIKKMGSLKDVMEKMPFFNEGMPDEMNDGQLDKVEAIILSMTRQERAEPDLLQTPSRLRRIASGSGTQLKDVREIVNRFYGMRKVMKQVGKQPGMLGQLPGFKQLGMLKNLRGAQMGGLLDELGEMGLDDMGAGRAARVQMDPKARQAAVDAKKKRRAASKKAQRSRRKNKGR